MRYERKMLPVLGLLVVLALVGAACGGGGGTTTGKKGGTFVFGASADPVSLDGPKVSDGESIRVIYQIFEGLVRTKDGGFDPVPSLAKSWKADAAGTAWTFDLQSGVKFHDGTPFNAAAVCFNFERWYKFTGLLQSDSITYYWQTVFGGFSDKKLASLYKSCEAKSDTQVVLNLTKPSASFIAGLTLPSFSIASPTALKQYNADKVSGTADSPKFEGEYDLAHPTGTGPYKFVSFTPKNRLVLARNDDYWGTKANFDQVIFRAIEDAAARRQALESGEVQAFENPDPGDINTLKTAGFQVAERAPFNVGYVGMNQKIKPFDNLKIRQAVAYALNKQALLTAKYPPGAVAATQFMPKELPGWSPDVTQYEYSEAKAKQAIKDSGLPTPVNIEFAYPTGVSRGYMPDPAANFQAFKADLEKVGFKVKAVSAPWRPDYNQKVHSAKYGMYLLGWLADFGDADNFIGVFFQQYSDDWGFTNPAVFSKLDEAEKETDAAKRVTLYQEANKLIMDLLPGVPYVHTATFVVLGKNVKGFIPSPINLERYSIMSFA